MHQYAVIDPLAVILPTSVYLKLMDQIHPNTPLIESLSAIKLTAAETTETRSNTKRLIEFANAVNGVIG